MEQVFAAFGIQWQLLLAQAVNFTIVLIVLTYFLYKPILKLLGKREEKIKQGIKDAEEATVARKEVADTRADILAIAETEAEEVVGRAATAGKREREAILRDAEGRVETMVHDAEARAYELKRQALDESEKEIAKTAVLAAEKILQESAGTTH